MYKWATTKEMDMSEDKPKFRNVALLLDDHAMLDRLAKEDQRTKTRQLSVLIKREYERVFPSEDAA